MNRTTLRILFRPHSLLGAATLLLAAIPATAQVICPAVELTSGLQLPLGITQSTLGNLLVSETGTAVPNTGRISIIDLEGNRRTLLSGLPSGINDVREPSGPAGLVMRGRTLYVAIGVGDVGRAGPVAGTTVPNPDPLSSPIFSSVLAIHFSADVEKRTEGFTLSLADQQTLANGEKVTLSYGAGETIAIELITDFVNYTANPLPFLPSNVRLSNPFDLVALGDQLYVTDGGQNLVWEVDINSGAFSSLASFPTIPNPLTVGPPNIEAVPTGIAVLNRELLVTLFRGAPFAPGTSIVERVDPRTGGYDPFITGLKTAIDVLPITERRDTDYLVLQHSSGPAPFFTGPGLLLRFETPGDPPVVLANCLNRPTSMALDEKTGTLYVTELVTGRIAAIPLGQ